MKRNHLEEFKNILYGIIIGLLAGTVISVFRLLIVSLMKIMTSIYVKGMHNLEFLLVALAINLVIGLLVGLFVKKQPLIKGSGIPQVEGQLLGELDYKWWSILWRKFVGGVLAIGSGLYLGREGPSIQLGSTVGQGFSESLKLDETSEKIMISSGAAAGLSAAFNAPIASTIFVLEEIYSDFATNIWLVSLTAAISSDMVVTDVFGLKPVFYMPTSSLPIKYFFWVILFGIILGILGRLYQVCTLNIDKLYRWLFKFPSYLFGVVPLIIVIPLGGFFPGLLGGGNNLILNLSPTKFSLAVLFLFLVIRFVFSAVSYGSGLPGGIFLPILCLGAVIGAIFGKTLLLLGLLNQTYFASFIIMGMAGYFACISKAPFTAILLITEMVGSLNHLLGLATVSLVAYLVVDLLGGSPIYFAMMENLLPTIKKNLHLASARAARVILPVFVGSQVDGKKISNVSWPEGSLLIKIERKGVEIVPNGQIRLKAGDSLDIEIDSEKSKQINNDLKLLTK